MGSNQSDKYLNTKTPKCLNKSILDASGKMVSPFLRNGEWEKRRQGEMTTSQMITVMKKIDYRDARSKSLLLIRRRKCIDEFLVVPRILDIIGGKLALCDSTFSYLCHVKIFACVLY